MLEQPPRNLLARYAPHLQPSGPIVKLGNAGGQSGAVLWRFQAAAGDLVCRAWPVGGPDDARLATIHGWLDRCRDLRFVPAPIPARDGRTFCWLEGRFWELAPWLPGAPDLGDPPGRGHVEEAFRRLAELHGRLAGGAATGPSPGLAARVRELEALGESGLDRIEAAVRDRSLDPCADTARWWIALARKALPGVLSRIGDQARLVVPLQPCLRDARPEHFLFLGKTLRGLVDFGAMGIESVAGDLARLLGDWLPEREDLRAAALAAYREVRPLDGSEEALISAFEAAADLLIAGHWIRWHFLEQRQFDDPGAVPRGISRGLERLRRRSLRAKD